MELLSEEIKNSVLKSMEVLLKEHEDTLLNANKKDIADFVIEVD